MRIAIDCRMSGKSGIGTFLDSILPYFNTKENELLLLGLESIPSSFSFPEKAKTLPCTINTFSIKEMFFFPRKLLNEINKCDVYFTPYCNIPCGINIPIYSTIHDIVFLDMPNIAGRAGTFIRKMFYKRAVKKSKAIFTVSEFSKQRIIEKLHCNKNIYVVYNGVPEYFERSISPAPKKTNSIIFIGNIKAHKGLKTLLESFTKFRDSSQFKNKDGQEKPKLVIVGSQENFRTEDKSICSLISDSSSKGIIFTGYVSDERLHVLLSEARILVQPSLYEGFGIPPLEALYSGTNVIVSDIPVFKEIYKDFPVVFFEVNNSNDLLLKIDTVWNSKNSIENFSKKYSYNETASMILKMIKM